MASKFIEDFKHTARQDMRIFFLPIIGAITGVKKELATPVGDNSFRALAVKDIRLFFAPFVGIAAAYKAEWRHTPHSK